MSSTAAHQRPRTFDCIVVGRGAVGLAAAIAMRQQGWKTAVVAPAARPVSIPEDGWDLRVFALSPASRELLRALEAWDRMPAERIAPVYDMRLFNGADASMPMVHLDAYRSQQEALAWIVEDAAIDRALNERLQALRIESIDAGVMAMASKPGASGTTLHTLQLDNGSSIATRLVIAADGRDSTVRRLAGLESQSGDRGIVGLVSWFEAERSHRNCAWQWFGPRGVLGVLPLPSDDLVDAGRSRISIVWSLHAEYARDLQRSGDLAERVAEAMGGRGADVADDAEGAGGSGGGNGAGASAGAGGALGALIQKAPAGLFPIRPLRCPKLIAPGLVLIGDAAHAVHPMAGQGMNLGFGDVASLVRTLPKAGPRSPDWFSLRRYERSRAEPVGQMQWALEGLETLFPDEGVDTGPLGAPLMTLRDAGWRLVASSSWLRRQMVRHAAGIGQGEAPIAASLRVSRVR